ncbi:hypothetical protein PsorP6_016512 [Peronosclerospora sorghi]|uniref:Uncharacterized protein n=1 Tax=Peronosclerospora sorghi TaxID=230839 RepID=A0ACC0VS64_9STRA|nr:hypothetical protein PsorP6_016512 [Peronosclerospora sorghi]
MSLYFSLLLIASALFTTTDLASASSESNRSMATESDTVRMLLRANLTDNNKSEERTVVTMEMIEDKISQFTDFPINKVRDLARESVQPHPGSNTLKQIRQRTFRSEYLDELRRIGFNNDEYINVAAYLVLLKRIDGRQPIERTAKMIDDALMNTETKDIARVIQDGQFRMWSKFVGSVRSAKQDIFQVTHVRSEWKKRVLERYGEFLDEKLPTTKKSKKPRTHYI